MAFTKIHPTRYLIDTRYNYIKKLINEYPRLKESMLHDSDKECKDFAQENAGEDKEVAQSIYEQEVRRNEDVSDLNNIFYQSMLMITYSYYEGIIRHMMKDINAKHLIEAICKQQRTSLSIESEKAVAFIDEEVKAIRNNICHNNAGTCNKQRLMSKLSSIYTEIDFTEDTIGIYDSKFILNALELEHQILIELADILKYNNKVEGTPWKPLTQEWPSIEDPK